jgi:hypothetical protein
LSEILNWAFRYVLYPVVLVGIFLVILDMLYMVVSSARNRMGKIRRLTGAILPWAVLVFLSRLEFTGVESIRPWINTLHWAIQLIAGMIVGILVMEFGKALMKSGGDAAASTYALFLSCFGAFLVWMAMQGFIQSVHFALLGLVISGALHVIFRGPPEVMEEALAPNNDTKGEIKEPFK